MKPCMALVLVLLGIVCQLHADPPAPVDFLLLKNGAVLTGRVVQEGNSYIIRSKSSSGESRYPASMVAKVCSGPLEAYAYLKKCSVPEDSNEHCRLAQFCMNHELRAEAKVEINAALKADPRSSQAQTLARQWTTRQNKPSSSSPDIPVLPGNTVLPLQPVKLEDWPTMLTPQANQDFALRIQPALISGCGTGACHGVSEGKRAFVLKRGLNGVPASPAMTKYNLERVLALVDEVKPDASELLQRAFQPHGNIKQWPVSKDQFAVLRQWVYYATGKQPEIAKSESSSTGSQQTLGKSANTFASMEEANDATTKVLPASEKAESSTLPTIPGMSGAAIQQVADKTPASVVNKPPVEEPKQSSSPGGLPSIPGVSGKGQSGNKPEPQQVPPAKPNEPRKNDPRTLAEFQDYLKRLAISPTIPAPTEPLPTRMHIVNAGTYQNNIVPPLPAFSEEVLEQINRMENAKKAPAFNEPANKAGFLNSGTVVNQPPR